MLKQAIYDNFETRRREMWQDGNLIGSVIPDFAEQVGYIEAYRGHHLWPAINAGQWVPGKVRGDVNAISKENRPC